MTQPWVFSLQLCEFITKMQCDMEVLALRLNKDEIHENCEKTGCKTKGKKEKKKKYVQDVVQPIKRYCLTVMI